jgi:hypothetical protein
MNWFEPTQTLGLTGVRGQQRVGRIVQVSSGPYGQAGDVPRDFENFSSAGTWIRARSL